jgi:cell wall-associated NlpC family hydrolase
MPRQFNKYVGLPYKNFGRDPVADGGVDCYGLILYILKKEFGINVKEHSDATYFEQNEPATAKKIIEYSSDIRDWVDVDIKDIQAGDVVLMSIKGYPIHMGLAISKTHMIHVFFGANAVIERFDTFKWEKRIWGVKRAVI